MMKKLLPIALLILVNSLLFSQAEKQLDASDWKMTQAKMLFTDNNFSGAISVYLELYKDYPSDDLLNLRIAECYFATNLYDSSRNYLNIALENNQNDELLPRIYNLLGQVNHKLNDFELATKYYSMFLVDNKTVDTLAVQKLLKQVEIAKNSVENPFNYSVKNIGAEINTNCDEIFPIAAWNNQMLYFTSNRQVRDNQEKNTIKNAYNFSNFSVEKATENNWGKPLVLDEYFSKDKDFILTYVSELEKELYLSKNRIVDGDGGDVYFSKLDAEYELTEAIKFSEKINTEFYEASASYDLQNEKIFFVSDVKDKNRVNSDIYLAKNTNGKLLLPVPVDVLNTPDNESFVYVHPSGKFIVFSSNCDKSMGGYDLFISYNVDGKWTEPKNMGYPINSTSNEFQFSVSYDAEFAFISSDRPGGQGGIDIYQVEIKPFFVEQAKFVPELITISGQVTSEDGTGIEAKIVITNKSDSKNSYDFDTDSQGNYSFVLNAQTDYLINIKGTGYLPISEDLVFIGKTMSFVEEDYELQIKK